MTDTKQKSWVSPHDVSEYTREHEGYWETDIGGDERAMRCIRAAERLTAERILDALNQRAQEEPFGRVKITDIESIIKGGLGE